jgi:hypothetical protein
MIELAGTGLLLLLLTLVFALPGFKRQSAVRAMLMSFLVVILPVLMFLVSLMIGAEVKVEAPSGAFDCFQKGKAMLTPIVLWAIAGLYTVEVRRRRPAPRWAAWGIVSGAIVSTVTLIVFIVVDERAMLYNRPRFDRRSIIEVVQSILFACTFPGYVTAWYLVRARDVLREGGVTMRAAAALLGIHAPFWVATAWNTRRIYANLPVARVMNDACFVVSAAARGHRAVVGPVVDDGPVPGATRQLVRFWALEARWRSRHPKSHAAARRLYDRIGPAVARRIRTPWRADVVYVLLKPLELFAVLLVRATRTRRRPD